MPGFYSIPIGGLKEGTYTYDFTIGREFFEGFEESEVREGSGSVTVLADKRTSHLDLTIVISGTVMISCDRCLGMFSHPVECTNRLLVKFGKNLEESDPDIISVPRDENELDMAQYFYEYIMLALPIQRVHPPDSKGRSTCDPGMMLKLHEHEVSGEETADPRWDELRKLINNN
ncbi:MAG: DUF177 domain-containing protein [Bacteroidales bacterium]|jgi:uncharacterized metal-binding protein YceD (DUF177 family)|nr:DUF177 domain-containing protein [Bacteroidales bacterium]